MDLFRTSGDALIGRYFLFHLFPFSYTELAEQAYDELHVWHALLKNGMQSNIGELIASVNPLPHDFWNQLYDFGPFPEPLLKGDNIFSNLWHQDYLSLYLREELRDLTRISDIDGVESLVRILPHRIGSILSLNSLKQDLQVSHGTIKGWLASLTIPGYAHNIAKKLGDVPVIQLVNVPNIIKKIDAREWVMSASHFFSAFP